MMSLGGGLPQVVRWSIRFRSSLFVLASLIIVGMDKYRVPAGTGIGHVHLKVSDIERALAFYTGVLGLRSDSAAG